MFLATSYYRSMNIGDMRIFDTEEDAWEYADTLIPDHLKNHSSDIFTPKTIDSTLIRVYKLSNTEEPKLLKRNK